MKHKLLGLLFISQLVSASEETTVPSSPPAPPGSEVMLFELTGERHQPRISGGINMKTSSWRVVFADP